MPKCELTQLTPASLRIFRSSAPLYLARPPKPEFGVTDRRAQLDRLKSGVGKLLDRAGKILGDHFPDRPRLTSNRHARADWREVAARPRKESRPRRYTSPHSSEILFSKSRTFEASLYSNKNRCSVKWRTHYRLGLCPPTPSGGRYPWKSGPSRAALNVGYQMGFSACGRPRFSLRRSHPGQSSHVFEPHAALKRRSSYGFERPASATVPTRCGVPAGHTSARPPSSRSGWNDPS